MSFARLASLLLLAAAAVTAHPQAPAPPPRRNIILFIADGLRRGSVTADVMPTFARLRATGTDFRNSHSVFPTFTTANASVIATGHGLGDTGDYSNTIYPGVWLTKPEVFEPGGYLTPFLEANEVLANMNSTFSGNYLGERTLLNFAHEKGFNVASVGKLGPTAIQQIESVKYSPEDGRLGLGDSIILDDATGRPGGLQLPSDLREAILNADLSPEAPLRTNGYGESSQYGNAFAGDASTPGTLASNHVQEQWMADVTTRVLLPQFAASEKPFILLFWSRDPDGSQHDEGDSLQQLNPGINGETSTRGLRNADHCLKQLLDWLDQNPAIKANTDIVITSDHGFATISRREVSPDGKQTGEVSSGLPYELSGKEKPQPRGTLPSGFLAVDLAVRQHLRLFDSAVRASAGDSVYQELTVGGEHSQHPSTGSALLGDRVSRIDGSDAKLLVAANGGSDLLYVPDRNPVTARETVAKILATLTELDYVGGIFIDDSFCPKASSCPGALPLSAIRLIGSSKVPRPTMVVTFKVFNRVPGDLQTAAQISDTTLQEGQGMHGGFGRDQTWNNMAALGPDFRAGFTDDLPMGNMDLVPTLAHLLGLTMPSVGTQRGRILTEALTTTRPQPEKPAAEQHLISAPADGGIRTLLEFQEHNGVRYLDRACLTTTDQTHCP